MPTLTLNEIECLHPGEAGGDEVWLSIRTEQHPAWTEAGELGVPREMREEESLRLQPPGADDPIDPIEFDEYLCVRLLERDPLNDSIIGGFSFTRPFRRFGPGEVFLPSELVGAHAQAYRVSYDYAEEPAPHPRHRIELLSLTCNDAQGTSDRVGLYVNEVLIWGPEIMRTRQVEEFGTSLSHTFHRLALVTLRETRGEDWSRSFTLVPGEYPINRRREHDFMADSDITGDAHYTLAYRMRLLPAR
jgi:hypothetical protein